jgi:peptidoglycan/xylan/chitin deacetylase (PgdA/CDA1 family)/membrane-associated phospholipid phosphatase
VIRRTLDVLGLPILLLALAGALGLATRTSGLTSVDLHLDQAVQAMRTGWLTAVAQVLNVGFGPPAGLTIVVALTAALFLAGRSRTAVTTFLVIAVGWTFSSVFKALIARPRPPVSHQLISELGNDSFPSGHVALTMSLAVAVAFLAHRTRYFRPVVVVGVVFVVAQAMARLYLGVHYPSDVVGSILVSTAGTGAVLRLSALSGTWTPRRLGRPGVDGGSYTGSDSGDVNTVAAITRRPVLRLGAVLGAAAAAGTVSACAGEPAVRATGENRTPAGEASPSTGGTATASPRRAPSPSPSRSRHLPPEVEHGPRDRPLVALTFHGAGPVKLAESVLATAERAGAHVTVLAVGTWLDLYPQMARRVLSGGHDLGNHTQRHLDISSMNEAAAHAEIAQCAARLKSLTGSVGSWFRPSASRHATPLVRGLAARAGYRTCLSYDLDSLDYTDPGPAAVAGNVLRDVRGGSIVSLHLGHPGTLAALPRILDGLSHRGLRAVTVTELLAA